VLYRFHLVVDGGWCSIPVQIVEAAARTRLGSLAGLVIAAEAKQSVTLTWKWIASARSRASQ